MSHKEMAFNPAYYPDHPLVQITAKEICPGGPTEYLIEMYAIDARPFDPPAKTDYAKDPEQARLKYQRHSGGVLVDALPTPCLRRNPTKRRK